MKSNLHFVRNLRVGNKLLLLAVCFLLPIIIVVYQLVEEKNTSITVAEKELIGITCLNPLQHLQTSIAKYSIIMLEAGGSGASGGESAKKEVEAALREALRVNQPYAAELETTSLLATLSKNWDIYASSPTVENAQQVHAALREVVSTIGDKSSLILVPDLDSYYLVDAMLVSMPQIIDLMNQLAVITYQGSKEGVIVHEDKERIDMNAGTLHESTVGIKHSFATALLNAQDKTMPGRLKPMIDKLMDHLQNFEEITQKKIVDGDKASILENRSLLPGISTSLLESIDRLDKEMGVEVTNLLNQRMEKLTNNKYITLAAVGLMIALMLWLVMTIWKSITRPVKELEHSAIAVSKGDLTVRIERNSNDEFGNLADLFNEMIAQIRAALEDARTKTLLSEQTATEAKEANKNINELVYHISETVETTATATAEISASFSSMTSGALRQSEQAGNVAAAVEEMTSNIIEGNRAMTLAVDKARRAGDSAKHGGEVVVQTINGMNKIADVVMKSASTVQALGKSSEEIGEIVQVINDIADQTNLLALNAAIEAARAGEQGRGFAVVADEVRKLAERTAEATKQIGAMIKRIQRDTAGAVSSMKLGTEEVESGKVLADRAGESLKEIITVSEDVQTLIAQLARASSEQETTSADIARNIQHISSVAIENKRAIDEVNFATDDLSRQMVNLRSIISKFGAQAIAEKKSEEFLKVKQLQSAVH